MENKLGFSIDRNRITWDSGEPHDETFSYCLCQKYYGKKEKIIQLISELKEELKITNDRRRLCNLHAIIGNLYYLSEDYGYAAGHFMKSISNDREDITSWFEFLFSLRAFGENELFEKAIFNIEKLIKLWNKKQEIMLTQEKFIRIVEEISS